MVPLSFTSAIGQAATGREDPKPDRPPARLPLTAAPNYCPFSFNGQEFALGQDHALYWPAQKALLVADLHLEKGSYYAQHGQMLPPYDSRETLARVARALEITGAKRVITLGDNFHDDAGLARLEPQAAQMLAELTAKVDWVWITGNHDMHLSDGASAQALGGAIHEELELDGIMLRHEAVEGELRPEISGHFHPRLKLRLQGRHIRRPCAIKASIPNPSRTNNAERMILPAFGAYTGGMDAQAPEIARALSPARQAEALIATRHKITRFALGNSAG